MDVSSFGNRDRRSLRRFVDFSWDLYRDDPHWIPPIKSQVAKSKTAAKQEMQKLNDMDMETFIQSAMSKPDLLESLNQRDIPSGK